MEENQPKIGKFGWTYGLLFGAISVVFGVMLFSMDMHYEQGWTNFVVGLMILAGVIAWASTQYKKANTGYFTISDGLKLGAAIAVVGTIISLLWYAALTNIIEPDFTDKAMEIAKVKAFEQNPKITEEQWQQGVEMQKKFAWMAYPIGIVLNVILGLVIGLITGLIIKKEKPAY